MSVGSWSPDAQQQANQQQLEAADLDLLVSLAGDSKLQNLDKELGADDQQRLAALLKANQAEWQQALTEKPADYLWQLIRFFTVAEMKLPGWQCGNDSPVIKINKLLKQQGQALDKDQLLWIRNNSNNRYIPNGAIML